jgi:hypothetical protein
LFISLLEQKSNMTIKYALGIALLVLALSAMVVTSSKWSWAEMPMEERYAKAALYTMTTGALERGNFVHPDFGFEVPIEFELMRCGDLNG